MRALTKKLRANSAGFSLAETLIVVLILLMVSAVIGAAIPTAANVFTKTVDTANAQVVLSTTMTALRDELCTVTEFEAPVGNSLIYKSKRGWAKLEFGEFPVTPAGGEGTPAESDGGEGGEASKVETFSGIRILYLTKTYDEENGVFVYTSDETDPSRQRYLVSPEAVTANLKIQCDRINAEKGVITFSNLKVIRSENPTADIASRETFSVKTMMKDS